jgi:hypothetical protein
MLTKKKSHAGGPPNWQSSRTATKRKQVVDDNDDYREVEMQVVPSPPRRSMDELARMIDDDKYVPHIF